MDGNQAKYVKPHTVAMTFATFALSVLALLLWGRIKLVTGVPRTAYAEPKIASPVKPQPAPKPIPANRPDLRGD